MNDKELKPCPFCGGEARIVQEYDAMIGETFYFCECINCTGTILYGKFNKKEYAIEAWNRRVNDERD